MKNSLALFVWGRGGLGFALVRRFVYGCLAFLIILALGVFFGAQPLVEYLVQQKANSRGLLIQVGTVHLSPTRVRLRHLQVDVPKIPGVRASLETVDIRFRWPRLQIVEIAVLGGKVSIDGEVAEVAEHVRAWRGRTVRQPTGAQSSRKIVMRSIDLKWTNAFGDGLIHRVQGVQMDRSSEETLLGADALSIKEAPWALELKGLELKIKGSGAKRELVAANAQELKASFSGFLPKIDSVPLDPEAPELAPVKTPSTKLPSDAEVKEAEGLATQFMAQPERERLLRRGLTLLRERVLPSLPKKVQVRQLFLELPLEENQLSIGPSRLSGERKKSRYEFALTPDLTRSGTKLTAAAYLPFSAEEELEIKLKGGPLSLFDLGVREGQLALAGVRQTHLRVDATILLKGDGSSLSAEGQASLDGLIVSTEKLADQPVILPALEFEGKASMRVDGQEVSLSELKIGMGDAQFIGAFRAERKAEGVELQAKFQAPLVSCQALASSAPEALLGPLSKMKFDGSFSLSAGVQAQSSRLSEMSISWDFNNHCRITQVPAELSPARFKREFRLEVAGAGGFPVERSFGPDTGRWYRIDEITPYLEKAVLVTEDARFYRHRGFDDRAIESAIRANTRAGRFMRGASTISMQLAKNLYLSRDKRLSRKLKEAAFTLLLEQELSKKEILETYFNVIEFGPDVYGIGDAAHHYFQTTPRQLSLAQAFFLASILPAPTRDYFNSEGQLKSGRVKYVHHLLEVAKKRGRITPSEYESAVKEEITFGDPEAVEELDVPDSELGLPEAAGPAWQESPFAHLPPPGGLAAPGRSESPPESAVESVLTGEETAIKNQESPQEAAVENVLPPASEEVVKGVIQKPPSDAEAEAKAEVEPEKDAEPAPKVKPEGSPQPTPEKSP